MFIIHKTSYMYMANLNEHYGHDITMKHFQIIHDYAALRTHEVQYHTDISFFKKFFILLQTKRF